MKKSRGLKIFLIVTLLVSLQIPSIAVTTGVVNTDTVRVRSKATTDSSIVALVSIGDEITIIEENENWYKVEAKDDDGNDVEGYIRKDLLTVEGDVPTSVTPSDNKEDEPEVAPSEPEEPDASDDPEDAEQPGESEVPGETQQPDETENPGENEGTDDVENSTGEAPAENNTMVDEKETKTISTLKSTGGLYAGKTMQLAEQIMIKILPSANSTNIAKIEANTQITVLEVINNWSRIETEGACGWVRIDQ